MGPGVPEGWDLAVVPQSRALFESSAPKVLCDASAEGATQPGRRLAHAANRYRLQRALAGSPDDLAGEEIQKQPRAHDADAVVLFQIEQV